jgi:hypothetical protein
MLHFKNLTKKLLLAQMLVIWETHTVSILVRFLNPVLMMDVAPETMEMFLASFDSDAKSGSKSSPAYVFTGEWKENVGVITAS